MTKRRIINQYRHDWASWKELHACGHAVTRRSVQSSLCHMVGWWRSTRRRKRERHDTRSEVNDEPPARLALLSTAYNFCVPNIDSHTHNTDLYSSFLIFFMHSSRYVTLIYCLCIDRINFQTLGSYGINCVQSVYSQMCMYDSLRVSFLCKHVFKCTHIRFIMKRQEITR